MRTLSKSVATVVAMVAMAAMALGASPASATITPTTGAVTATNTGTVLLASLGISYNCGTMDLSADINMDSPAGQGGGGIITGWTTGSCLIDPTGDFTPPWTLNINTHVGTGSTWTGSITGIDFSMSFCHWTGSLPIGYDNGTGRLTVTGGSLGGGVCGAATITVVWNLHLGSGFPILS